MIRIVPVEAPRPELLRSWLVFFSDGDRPGLSRLMTRSGFRHVEACAYFADQDRWVFVIPSRRRMMVLVKRSEESESIYAAMLDRASAVVRVNGCEARNYMPATVGCVGAVKALLGIKSRALLPHRLFRDLLAQGAEIIHVIDVLRPASAAACRSEDRADAEGRTEARGNGAPAKPVGSTAC